MSKEPIHGQFDKHTEQVREYARLHGISNAAAAQRIYKTKMIPQWTAEEEAKYAEGAKANEPTPVLPAESDLDGGADTSDDATDLEGQGPGGNVS